MVFFKLSVSILPHWGMLFNVEISEGLLNICFVYDIIVHVIEQKVGCDFPIVRCPLVLRKRDDANGHNGSTYTFISCFCGSILHR